MKGEEAFATGDKPVLAHASASGSGAGASPKDGITPRTDYSFYNGTSHATDEEEERGDGEAWDAWYGADARRSWRGRPEGLVALWIVVALLVALSSSVGVGGESTACLHCCRQQGRLGHVASPRPGKAWGAECRLCVCWAAAPCLLQADRLHACIPVHAVSNSQQRSIPRLPSPPSSPPPPRRGLHEL